MRYAVRFERIREVRELRGYTLEELAARCGMSKSQIFRIETGKSSPSAETIARIARELAISADYLLGLVNDTSQVFTRGPLKPEEERLVDAFQRRDLQAAMRIFADSVDRAKDGRRLRES